MKSNAVAKELELIRRKHRGILRPADVIAFAADEETALHRKFEWNDTEAAHQYRLEQARLIIRTTVRVMREDLPPIHAYVSLQDDRKHGDSYRAIEDVMANAGLRNKLLAQAMAEAESWKQRYGHLKKLMPITDAIGAVKKKLERRKPKARKPKRVGVRRVA